MSVGLHIQADSGRSEAELYSLAIASGGRTHVVLNGAGLAARLLQAGKRVIYRRWAREIQRNGVWNEGDNMANDWYDPVTFVNKLHADAPAGAILALGNEPWVNTPDAAKRINDWTVTALTRCNALGRKAGIFSFPTGNPPDNNLWLTLRPALQMAKDGGHLLLLHQYFGVNGVTDPMHADNRPWHIDRDTLIPSNLPLPEIVVTELGYCHRMDPHKGYVGVMSDAAYADQLARLGSAYARRGVDTCLFVLTNKGNAHWDTFNASERIVARLGDINAAIAQEPPIVTEPTPAPDWYWHRPVRAPFVVTSPYGMRPTPEANDGDKMELHTGTDYAGLTDWNAYAAREGKVVFAGWNEHGYGNLVKLDHGGGYTSLYGHLDAISVTVGATVAVGQQIGVIGNTGRSTGRHLHFESRKDNVPYAPAPEMRPHPADIAPPPVVIPPPPPVIVSPLPSLPERLQAALDAWLEAGKEAHEARLAVYAAMSRKEQAQDAYTQAAAELAAVFAEYNALKPETIAQENAA